MAVYDVPPGRLELAQNFAKQEDQRWAREGVNRSQLFLEGVIREGTLGTGRHAIGRELGRFKIHIKDSQGLKFDIKNVKSSMQKFFQSKEWNSQTINILEVR